MRSRSFAISVGQFIEGYAAALGGIDSLAFTGGIGEHSPEVSTRICETLGFLGIRIDPVLNAANAKLIAAEPSNVATRIVETKEEVMIARFPCKKSHKSRSLDSLATAVGVLLNLRYSPTPNPGAPYSGTCLATHIIPMC
jgi:hypothetical protein